MIASRGNTLPFWIPARFLLTGMLALPVAYTTLLVRPEWLLGYHATPPLLAIVHIVTLLFATSIFAGAVQQLAPVLLATPLHSVPMARWSYPPIAVGGAGVVAGFALGYRVELLVVGGVLVLAGLVVVAVNLARTAMSTPKMDTIDAALVASFLYLVATVVIGTLLAASRRVPALVGVADALPLHLGLGLFGAFFLGIASAGHKLLAMFTLSHGVAKWRLRWLARLVHAAVALLLIGAVLDVAAHRIASLLLAGAVALFLLDTLAQLRERRRRELDAAIRHYLCACGFLVVTLALAAVGSYVAAVASLLAGFLTVLIGGMAVKILSFLAWQARYAPHVGRSDVPLLRDMPLAALERASLWGLGIGALGVVAAVQWSPSVPLLRSAVALGAVGGWALFAQGLWIVFGEQSRRTPSAGTAQEAT